MKNWYLKVLCILLSAFLSTCLSAQTAATRTTETGAALIRAMSLTETSPLHFGSSTLNGTAGGSIVLSSESATLTYTGDVSASGASPNTTNAVFQVMGTPLETYSLTLPATTTISHSSVSTGNYTMEITQMTARFKGAIEDATTSTLAADGTDTFTVGGTLLVGPNQVDGFYSGTFMVTVDYN